jgi:hypothetical protein
MSDELLKPDLSLLRDAIPQQAPNFSQVQLLHYNKGNKDLYYIGASHGTDFENRTHETIKQAIGKHRPQLVILEGMDTDKGVSPPIGMDLSKPADRERFLHHSGEGVHTAEYLRGKNIPFIGGEPAFSDISGALEKQGYSLKEVMALYLLRHISIWKRHETLQDRDHFPEQANKFFSKHPDFDFIPREKRLTFDEFKTWYDAHKAELGNKDMLDVTAADSNPPQGSAPNYFQKMSAIMDKVRDDHLVTLIADSLAANDKVLVVYGSAHQYKSMPVFEKMFGSKAEVEQLVLEEATPKGQPAAARAGMAASSELSKPSRASALLKYAGVGLLAAGGTAAAILGLLSVPAIALLAGGALAFAGSEVIPPRKREMQNTAAVSRAAVTAGAFSEAPQQAVTVPHQARSDGKSWVNASQSSPQEASRAI